MTALGFTQRQFPFAYHAKGLTDWQRDRFTAVAFRNRTEPRLAGELANRIRREGPRPDWSEMVAKPRQN